MSLGIFSLIGVVACVGIAKTTYSDALIDSQLGEIPLMILRPGVLQNIAVITPGILTFVCDFALIVPHTKYNVGYTYDTRVRLLRAHVHRIDKSMHQGGTST